MNKATILLCGDHSRMISLLERTLQRLGYACQVASLDDAQSPWLLAAFQGDLALVDNLTICRFLRHHRQVFPILFYSSDEGPSHVVQALDQGADDYIVVPFATEEFAARIRAQLRRAAYTLSRERAEDPVPSILQSADGFICLNAATHRVYIRRQSIHLTRTEFHLLQCFLLHAGETLTYDFLLKTVWGPEYEGMEDYVRIYVRRLRQKIEPDPGQPIYLRTRLHQGYVFDPSGAEGGERARKGG
jgi:two-component system KDP operon response regulator KdpE